MSPAHRRTPPESKAVDDELDGPASEVRSVVPLGAIPCLAISVDGLRFLPLDARSAYLLSLMDGHCTVDLILDVCDMDRDEVLAILSQLLKLGAIKLR